MVSVEEILRAKADRTVWTTTPGTPLRAAMQLMADKQIGALVVIDRGDVVGIVTERDYARKTLARDGAGHDFVVADIMSAPVIHVRPDHTSDDCIALMALNRLRHLPVIEERRLVGMVSIRDLVDRLIDLL
jgi:CBS domain-containing protein